MRLAHVCSTAGLALIAAVGACTLTTPLDDLSTTAAATTTTGAGGGPTNGSSSATGSSAASVGSGGVGGSGGDGSSGGGSGGSVALFNCDSDGTDALQDAFEGNTIDAAWGVFESGSAATLEQTGGELAISIGPTTGTVWANVRSILAYDLTDCYAHVEVVQALSDAQDTFTGFALYRPNVDTDYLEIVKYGGQLRAVVWIGGVQQIVDSIAYNPTLHAWWRIREKGGTVHFEVSSDGLQYQPLGNTSVPFDVTALEISLIAGANAASMGPLGQARYDRLNLPP